MSVNAQDSHHLPMISICIPQYNRIRFLLQSLEDIAKQTFPNIEISISDDCSTDTTEADIKRIAQTYKYPIRYFRQQTNQGYDRNLRYSIEMATSEYVMILGNDDTINPEYDLTALSKFLIEHNFPDIGFTNFYDAPSKRIQTRAAVTACLGHGPDVAFRYYSCFSFVGGIIFKKSVFLKYNTAEYDSSIFSQIYHSTVIIASGHELFSIADPVVIKDILPEAQDRKTYLDSLARHWKDYKPTNTGLHSVVHVLVSAFIKTGTLSQALMYRIFRKIYGSTFPFWIVDYRRNRALPAAIGIISGMRPHSIGEFSKLSFLNKIRIYCLYTISSIGGLVIPIPAFDYIAVHILKKSAPGQK